MLLSAFKSVQTPIDLRKARPGGPLFGTRGSRAGAFFMGNAEPSLDEVMGDPMILGLMARDGVPVASLETLIATVRDRLR